MIYMLLSKVFCELKMAEANSTLKIMETTIVYMRLLKIACLLIILKMDKLGMPLKIQVRLGRCVF